jgi:hypothetical protein
MGINDSKSMAYGSGGCDNACGIGADVRCSPHVLIAKAVSHESLRGSRVRMLGSGFRV